MDPLVRFIFQVVNFVILIWLLKRFLYGPIRRAMDARAERIRDKEVKAEESRAEADAEKGRYTEKLAELEADRERQLEEARGDADAERKRLVAEVQEDGERLRKDLAQTLEREKAAFLADASRRMVEGGFDVARRIHEYLAGEPLEARVVEAFLERLAALGAADRKAWAEAMKGGNAVQVRTAFDLPKGHRDALTWSLRALGEWKGAPEFLSDPALVCGITVTCGGHRLGWSVEGEIERLRAALDQELDAFERAAGPSGGGGGDAS